MAEQKVAQASPAGPRKKRRMGVSESFKMEIGVDQTIAMLKAEAVSVKHAGIAGFLGDDGAVVMEKLEPYLNSHLTVLTNASYPDREGKEHAGDNETTTGDLKPCIETSSMAFAPALGRRPSPPPPRFA